MKQTFLHILKPFNLAERLTLAYTLLTLVLTFVLWSQLPNSAILLLQRFAVIAVVFALAALGKVWKSPIIAWTRLLFPLALLAVWYPDTYNFSCIFSNQDHVFAQFEQNLFGCQPALTFAMSFPSRWWSEAMHLGYLSYYPLIFIVCLLPIFKSSSQSLNKLAAANLSQSGMLRVEWTIGLVLATFFIYYVIYMFVPVAGPQFYFNVIGVEQAAQGQFPAIGTYFQTHTIEAAPTTDFPQGLFHFLVNLVQGAGERPTAAFPSSHVGVSTIVLWLLFRIRRNWALCAIPLWILLCLSTIYIQAHYLIDAIVGLITAPLFFIIAHWITNRFFLKPSDNNS